MGKVVLQKTYVSKDVPLRSKRVHVVYSNLLTEVDANDRIVSRTKTDMLGRPIFLESMDRAPCWALCDANGATYYTWEGTTCKKTVFDKLRRPLKKILCVDGKTWTCTAKMIYGESGELEMSQAHNLRGRVVQQYDQSGCRTNIDFDWRGNCLSYKYQLARKYESRLNVDGDTLMEEEQYMSNFTYDALDRRLSEEYPSVGSVRYEYDRHGQITLIEVKPLQGEWITCADDIQYDSHMRMIAYRQGKVVTSCKFDPLSSKLSHKTITQGTTVLQNFRFIYDAVGNLTAQVDLTQKNLQSVDHMIDNLAYEYDSQYRLIKASGSENIGLTSGRPWEVQRTKTTKPMSNNAPKFSRYTETYLYSDCGNLKELDHAFHNSGILDWKRQFIYNGASFIENESKPCNRLSGSSIGSGNLLRYEYDSHGNMISSPDLHISWNEDDQMLSSQDTKERQASHMVSDSSVPYQIISELTCLGIRITCLGNEFVR